MKLRKSKKSEVRAAKKAARKAAKAAASHGSSPPAATSSAVDTSGAASDEVEAVQAMYQAALVRSEVAGARERAVAERVAAAEALEHKTAERLAVIETRERTAAERDSIANDRDLAAVERDRIANERDRALAERDAAGQELTAGAGDAADRELELADLEAKLHRAHLDALTGVFRREMGRLALRNEIERARRGDGRFVIAFIDVDGLKGVNDREGHAAGDRVLRMLAATMRANLRAYDPIVRFGGDEFVCGISAIDEPEVQHRIGVIDQSLRNATGVGITAGLATLTNDDGLDDLTARADEALLAAKRDRDN